MWNVSYFAYGEAGGYCQQSMPSTFGFTKILNTKNVFHLCGNLVGCTVSLVKNENFKNGYIIFFATSIC